MQLFERAVSQFVKDNYGVMDLHSVLETLADEKVEDYVKNGFYLVAIACGERFKPAPPVAPVAMSLKLAVAHFTNGADVAFVQGKYEATFLLVLGKAKQLSFSAWNGSRRSNGRRSALRCSRSARASRCWICMATPT